MVAAVTAGAAAASGASVSYLETYDGGVFTSGITPDTPSGRGTWTTVGDAYNLTGISTAVKSSASTVHLPDALGQTIMADVDFKIDSVPVTNSQLKFGFTLRADTISPADEQAYYITVNYASGTGAITDNVTAKTPTIRLEKWYGLNGAKYQIFSEPSVGQALTLGTTYHLSVLADYTGPNSYTFTTALSSAGTTIKSFTASDSGVNAFVTGNGPTDRFGLYGMSQSASVTFDNLSFATPVPLPAAAWLGAPLIAGLALKLRRRSL